MSEEPPVNTGASQPVWPLLGSAELRVLKIQTKLHQWAKSPLGLVESRMR